MVAPTATGTSSDFDITNIWLQLGYVPSPHFGVQAQLLTSNPDRKPFVDQLDTLDLRLTGKRSDAQLRLYWKPGGDSSGFRVDGLFGRTRWNGSGVQDEVRQGGISAGWRTPTFGLTASAFNRSRWTPWDLSAEAGWAPDRYLSASVEAGYQTHDRQRTSRWVALRGGLNLPLGVSLSGTLRTGHVVPTPALLATPAQALNDWQGILSWNRPWVGLELGYGHASAFVPQAYRPFRPTVDSLAPAPAADWVTVGWRLAPKSWLTFQGWYSNPRGGTTPDGIPPTHSITSITLRSKFWRTFRSGIYDFKAQVAYETWGTGVIGRDASGAAIPLDGASFWRTAIEIRLDRFLLYWDRYNLQASRKTYVPGFPMLNFGSTFGVRWEFLN
ncbi:MAG TPA: hypothetical protein VNH46_02945, partial [Gemmatimonadales bacterium]|nr:hypothetical protein [Gemmatimonadales bacterium]